MNAALRREVRLVPLTALGAETQMRILQIRNDRTVARWMYTDHTIGVNEHLAWLSRLKEDDRHIVFAVLDAAGVPLGSVSANGVDRSHRRTDWAYYLAPDARGGLGSAIEYAFIDFVFGPLGMEKLNCEVMAGNDAVVKLHRKFLFQLEGLRRSHVVKNGKRVDVQLLGLTKHEWTKGRSQLRRAYRSVLDRFKVRIDWHARDGGPSPIDAIQSARAKNNVNWMGILRLALEKSPSAAQPIVADIHRLDAEISALTQKLLRQAPRRK